MKNKIRKILEKLGIKKSQLEKKLLKLEKEFLSVNTISNGKKVLFTHSFSIYDPCLAHDKLMAFALKLRGFDIIATFCDGVQDIECNVYGGVWGGKKRFKKNCINCQKKSEQQWSLLEETNIYRYSSYLTLDDYRQVEITLKSIPFDQWSKYSIDGWEIGICAKDILVNNYVVADYKLIENHETLGRNHLKNLLIAKIASERIIKDARPDRIISNDSYYGMWKMWELLAKEYKVPFYSHWSGTRVGGWCYAYNDASMKLDFSASWLNYSKVDLTHDEKGRVEKWLEDRVVGKEMIIDTASLSSFKNEDFDLAQIDLKKPIALLSANVIWDLAALNKEIFTNSMSEWIIETVSWFSKHPEYQLIIKPHPAEYHPSIPQTKETVESILKKELVSIPKNVFVLSPKVSILVYDLIPLSKIGLVFTTSIGMEMAARGIPVVTAGKSHYRGYGFTIDPSTTEEYYSVLDELLSEKYLINKEKIKELAMKFIKFNFFHYFSKINMIDFMYGEGGKNPVNINIENIAQLKKGQNKHFDYMVDCIEAGEAILSENDWPKES